MAKAKAKAKADKLVERIVVGPKGIWVTDDEGSKRLAGIGETIKITAKSAKAFSHYLEAPGVAKAKAVAAQAEADALADEGEETETVGEGGDSAES